MHTTTTTIGKTLCTLLTAEFDIIIGFVFVVAYLWLVMRIFPSTWSHKLAFETNVFVKSLLKLH